MRKKRYKPWRKGPAQIIPFPARWQRAWLICLVSEGVYRGEVFGDVEDGSTVTGEGPHELVLSALSRPENRRGLPVVPCWRAQT